MDQVTVNIVGWAIAILTAIFSSIIGWKVAMKSAERQYLSNIDLNTSLIKRDLEIKTQDEAIRLLSNIRGYLMETLNSPQNIRIQFDNVLLHREYGIAPIHMDMGEIANEMRDNFNSLSKSIFDFTYFCESREIILSEFIPMKKALIDKFNETSNYYYNTYHNYSMRLKFKDIDNLTEDDFNELVEKSAQMNSFLYDILGYVYDYNVELQNAFLSDLFEYTIPVRNPPDPRAPVITRQNRTNEIGG